MGLRCKWSKISQQKISTGMNKDQVYLSWGEPDDVNSYTSSSLKIEQWVYGSTYLHFYNGKLESWTELYDELVTKQIDSAINQMAESFLCTIPLIKIHFYTIKWYYCLEK